MSTRKVSRFLQPARARSLLSDGPPRKCILGTALTAARLAERAEEATHAMPHPMWKRVDVEAVTITPLAPHNFRDRTAKLAVKTMRLGFDTISGYNWSRVNERMWINRIVFLETVAGVPGMVGAMCRHLKSLRSMQHDRGWIHTLLEGEQLAWNDS
eukprot:Polyplicarium_translucidae@DN3234_c0_g1_i3.p2